MKIEICEKRCSTCKQWKPLENFGIRRTAVDGLDHVCKKCACEASKTKRAQNIEKKRLYDRERWAANSAKISARRKEKRDSDPSITQKNSARRRKNRENNPALLARDKDLSLRRIYGISLEDYQTMLEEQGGRCAICGTPQSDLNKSLHTDHCHATGRVRGLLCTRCNLGIGYFKDSIERLNSAIKYLLAHEEGA